MDTFLIAPLMQPKLMVANYAAGEGLPIPQIFDSADDALEAASEGETIIARSEHPQEYAGASGLLESFIINKKILEGARAYDGALDNEWPERAGLFRALQGKLRGGSDRQLEIELAKLASVRLSRYCSYQGIDEQTFLKDVSYTYWRALGGYNQTIVADNAVADRYHLLTASRAGARPFFNYSVIDGGDVTVLGNNGSALETETFLKSTATFARYYERVRHLGRFDPCHCPIIECQWVDDVHYFLQYHRTRDMEESTFRIDRPPAADEIEASLVRGATPPDGLVVNTAFYYPEKNWMVMEREDASFDWHHNIAFSEIMLRRRDVAFREEADPAFFAMKACVRHLNRSKLFKPRVSVVAHFPELIDDAFVEKACRLTRENGVPFRVPIWVLSDGRRALTKILHQEHASSPVPF